MYRKQARIPTLAALAILLFGIGGGIFLVETSKPTTSQANATVTPTELQITNVTDTMFTVSWITSGQATGYVSYWDSNSPHLNAYDDRDEDGKPKKYTTHHVTIRNLKENTPYSFQIQSDGFVFDNSGAAYTQITGPKLATTTSLDPAYGVILSSSQAPATGTIVYLTIGKSQPLSTLVKTAGTWLIPLNNLRSQDLFTRPDISNSDVIQIRAVLSKSQFLSATTDIKNDSPVPTMTIGKTYDFRNLQTKAGNKLGSPSVLGATQVPLSPSPTPKKILSTIDFVFPSRDGDTTFDKKPDIRGVAVPGKDVVLVFSNPTQSGKATVKSDGTWSYKPTISLHPGKVTVNITTVNDSGTSVSQSRSFIVLKSGEQVLGESTPSGTLVPTSSLLPSPTVSYEFPTATPTPFIAGSTYPTYGFLAVGIFLVIFGIKFLIFS